MGMDANAALEARIAGIGFWANGLPSWQAARDFVAAGTLVEDAPRRPAPRLLAANERRRAPETVLLALEVAMAACEDAGRDPRLLPSVFTSTHGDLAITDYMAATLADDPRALSPIRFHNSVHNAAAGYWTIGVGCMAAATAISAGPATFAQGLLEALVQLATGDEAVLLTAYDIGATGPLGTMAPSEGLLGGALVLSDGAGGTRLRASFIEGTPEFAEGPLATLAAGNAMAPMLPLFDALAAGGDLALLQAGPGQVLRVELAHG